MLRQQLALRQLAMQQSDSLLVMRRLPSEH